MSPREPELHELIGAVCDGRASEAEEVRLAELLRSDSRARDEYLRFVDLHAALTDETVPGIRSELIDYRVSTGSASRPARASWRERLTSPLGALILGAAVLLFAVSLGWIPGLLNSRDLPDPGVATQPPAEPIATLLLVHEGHWGEEQLVEGQRLLPGKLQLERGTGVIRLDGGAEIVIEGPTVLTLENAGRVQLNSGEVIVHATDEAEGFTLHTPRGEIVDLGTEFGVKVASSGDTELQVLDGEVALRSNGENASEPRILRAGEAFRLEAHAARAARVEEGARRFAEVVREVRRESPGQDATVVDHFDHPPGVLPLAASHGGRGWAGPWRLRRPDERRPQLVEPPAELPELRITGESPVAPGMLQLPAGFSCYVRELAQPLRMDRDGVTFIGLVVRPTERPALETWFATSVRITLRSSSGYFDRWISGGLTQHLRPFIQTGAGIGGQGLVAASDRGPMVWVLKVVSRRGADDAVYFRIFRPGEDPGPGEPSAWSVEARNLDLSLPLDRVLLSASGPHAFLVDDLRIGPTWRSVTRTEGDGDAR